MADKEKNTYERESTDANSKMGCCGKQGFSEMMANCCGSDAGANERTPTGQMMQRCMRGSRWFPLAMVALGILLLLPGYYPDAGTLRLLWIAVAGFVALLGTFGLIMTGAISMLAKE